MHRYEQQALQGNAINQTLGSFSLSSTYTTTLTRIDLEAQSRITNTSDNIAFVSTGLRHLIR